MSFKDDDKEEVREVISAAVDDIRREIRGWKDALERKIKTSESLEDRILVVEKYMVEQREEGRRRKETTERWKGESTTSGGSGYSRGSRRSRLSDNVSIFEVERIVKRNLISEKEKEERKDNIIIKGWTTEEKVEKEKVKEFLKEKLGLEINVKGCKINGKVVVSLDNGEDKKEIMKRKVN